MGFECSEHRSSCDDREGPQEQNDRHAGQVSVVMSCVGQVT